MRTATPISRSAQPASARARSAPSPSSSRNSAIERTPSSAATASIQSAAEITAWFPVETTVWKPIPRRIPRALTAMLPLWLISATPPSWSRSTESPQSGARDPTETTPLQFGPQTGRPPSRAIAVSSRSSSRPASISPNPAERTIAPPQPRSIASERTAATPAAGIATTTASTGSGRSPTLGTQGRPWTRSRFGLIPQTSPSNPATAMLRRMLSP